MGANTPEPCNGSTRRQLLPFIRTFHRRSSRGSFRTSWHRLAPAASSLQSRRSYCSRSSPVSLLISPVTVHVFLW